ncbi:hypothetical protein CORC01_01298 [Colletotrichum orchidophilum]|uniref:Uncharacterized protein n=1 Tax=Colletotrichum orchidophilum TaxID=1209926 RepID=A0A1G4BQ58_9PEZI|nr:uncharacterized protein CORC01_01298 [Colletotrichum orchidophilum]OHF03579.1 hypothetical protein CORC01_01298 [Colletotrichum orchidophilum]
MPLAGPCKWSFKPGSSAVAGGASILWKLGRAGQHGGASETWLYGRRLESWTACSSCSSLTQPGHLPAMQSAALHPRYPSSSTIHPNELHSLCIWARIRASTMQHSCSPHGAGLARPSCFCCPVEQIHETQKGTNRPCHCKQTSAASAAMSQLGYLHSTFIFPAAGFGST